MSEIRMKASDPGFREVQFDLHLLGVLMNPQCWFDYRNVVPTGLMEPVKDTIKHLELEFKHVPPSAFIEWMTAGD